jgi:hypothetical protein
MKRLLGVLIAAVVLIGAAAAAIGLRTGSGDVGGTVSLVVTREYGAGQVAHADNAHAKSGDTVMRVLQRDLDVKTRYGGGFVQEIDGIAGGREDGRPVDWFFYVNGVESSVGATQRKVAPGDRIWWDRHVWQAAQRIPAVVGSFPEPFLAGEQGRRIPVKLICLPGVERSCDEVTQRLTDAGATGVARSTVQTGPGPGVLRVIVGRWADVRHDPVARTLERGPAASGVFARPDPTGARLVLLDELGNPVRTLARGAGLVAATAQESQQPTWVVTGTDDVGVDAAAAAMQEDRLKNHFALAISAGHDVALPTAEPGSGP